MPRSETVNLENSLLFQGLPRDVLAKIEDLARVDEFKPGERIFREGEPAMDLYILREGKVELTYTLPNDPDTDIRINDVSPGQVFAWSALAKGDTLSAQARAILASSAYIIPAEPLHHVFAEHPYAGYEVMTRLAQQLLQRLRQTRRELRWSHLAAR
jgi:CRP-like cAMP-binding protein